MATVGQRKEGVYKRDVDVRRLRPSGHHLVELNEYHRALHLTTASPSRRCVLSIVKIIFRQDPRPYLAETSKKMEPPTQSKWLCSICHLVGQELLGLAHHVLDVRIFMEPVDATLLGRRKHAFWSFASWRPADLDASTTRRP